MSTDRSPRVFVVQEPTELTSGWKPDLSTAAMYGALTFVFDAKEKISALPGRSSSKAADVMRDFRPSSDYLLVPNTGINPLSVPLSLGHLFRRFADHRPFQVKVLVWQRAFRTEEDAAASGAPRRGAYVPLTLFFN